MSAFRGKADITLCGNTLLRSLLGAKRTSLFAAHMSAFDPKQTSVDPSSMFDKTIPSLEAIGLKAARDVCKKLVEKLPDEEFAKKYFNIRGVQALGPNAPPLKQTICGTTWKLIRPDFDPRRDESPITSERELGPGDQILAAWSTHDVICPPDNRITVQGILHH
jgi:hypothetical protein